MTNQIVGYNWDGTPIYGLKEVTIKPAPTTTKNSNTAKLDINNVIDALPGTITAIGGLFQKPQPVNNYYNEPMNGAGLPGGNNFIYIAAAVLIVVLLIVFKK